MQSTLGSYSTLRRDFRNGASVRPPQSEPDRDPDQYRLQLPWWIGTDRTESDPMPYRVADTARFIAMLASLKHAAGATQNPKIAGEVRTWADGGIADAIDEFCGTVPHKWPPGPPVPVLQLAAELAAISATLTAGDLAKDISGLSGRVLEVGLRGA